MNKATCSHDVSSFNFYGRSYTKVSMSMVKNRRRGNTIQPAPPGALENLINKIGSLYGDMDLAVTRPNGTKLNAIVEVTLGKVLKAVLVFKGMMIEWVVIRGFTEDSTRVDGQVMYYLFLF